MADFDMATAGFPPMTIPCEKCGGSGVYAEYNPFDYVPAKTCDDCNGTGQRDNRDAVILAMCGRLVATEMALFWAGLVRWERKAG